MRNGTAYADLKNIWGRDSYKFRENGERIYYEMSI